MTAKEILACFDLLDENDGACTFDDGVANARDFAGDVQRLREALPEFAPLSDAEVAWVYSDWGEDTYCAEWLMLEYGLREFTGYVRERLALYE